MDNDQLDDLKQFIDSKIFQSESRIKKDLGHDIKGLREDVNDGFAGVGEAISEINDKIDKRDEQVDSRLTKLEKQPA